jgi:hypothetical protein
MENSSEIMVKKRGAVNLRSDEPKADGFPGRRKTDVRDCSGAS